MEEVINEANHPNQTMRKEAVANIMQQMSPSSDEDFIDSEEEMTTSSINNKDKGPRTTKRSRRSTDRECSKKQKVKETEEALRELKKLL